MFFLHAWYIERFVREQRESLIGYRFHDAFSVSKNELFLQWLSPELQLVNWRLHWDAGQFFISFPEELNIQARKRLKQFHHLASAELTDCIIHPDERSFELVMDSGQVLLIQCYGPNAKVTLWKSNECQASFHGKAPTLPDWESLRNPKENYSAQVQGFAWYQSLQKLDSDVSLEEWKKRFLTGAIYLHTGTNGFDINPWPYNAQQTFSRISDAWQNFSSTYLKTWHFANEKQRLQEQWNKRLSELHRSLKSAEIKFNKLSNAQNYRHYGDLIMSNLWQIGESLKEVSLDDYISGSQLIIPLKSSLNAQENAERYYQKAKNQNIELGFAEQRLASLKEQVTAAEQAIAGLEKADNWPALKPFMLAEKEKAIQDERSPYHQFHFMGYTILVGKSATDNDQLTLHIAKKDDLWLHARDVAGSHVIIKQRSGQGYPESLIEAAASLAAWFSKRKNESLCPVIYTQKKFIRKRKGMHAGQVVVEKEKVVMVKPESPDQLFGK
ncbi:MAG: DUF814 domain-containing protein [Bacteroidetes bacterium]|nr:MAG: DUF814 domain-containing protein [Bacteroidota bacterium]